MLTRSVISIVLRSPSFAIGNDERYFGISVFNRPHIRSSCPDSSVLSRRRRPEGSVFSGSSVEVRLELTRRWDAADSGYIWKWGGWRYARFEVRRLERGCLEIPLGGWLVALGTRCIKLQTLGDKCQGAVGSVTVEVYSRKWVGSRFQSPAKELEVHLKLV